MILFISVTCLDVFSSFSLRTSTCLVVFFCFLRTCNYLSVFYISLSELLKSFSMPSTIIMIYAMKSGSSFSGVLGCPGPSEVGVMGSDDGEWSWISVSKILIFAFCHLVISGVSCFSCLWLELVPQVIMLASVNRPGRLALS